MSLTLEATSAAALGRGQLPDSSGVEHSGPAPQQRIAWVTFNRLGRHAVKTMGGDGSDQRVVRAGWKGAMHVAWSAAHGRLALTNQSSGPEIEQDIWTMRPDGTGVTRITRSPDTSWDHNAPDWSPSGRLIVFSLDVWDTQLPQICLMRADGTHKRRLTPRGPTDNEDPEWSRDGSRIAYTCHNRGRAGSAVCVLSTGTPNAQPRLYPTRDGGEDPSWSPDGRRLVYASSYGALWVLDLKTGRHRRLTAGYPLTADTAPAWSPDGSRIAFARAVDPDADPDTDNSNIDVYTVGVDGRNVRRLTFGPDADEEPVWQK